MAVGFGDEGFDGIAPVGVEEGGSDPGLLDVPAQDGAGDVRTDLSRVERLGAAASTKGDLA
jgi:hypothetical protein